VLSRRPGAAKVAVLFLTPACDLACPYCGAPDDFGVLSQPQAVGLLDHLVSQGFESVVLGGGEPLRWPHGLRQLCASARARGLLTQVGTNAANLPADAADWREVDRWVLPLESADHVAHDALRPMNGSHHERILQALDGFVRSGAEVTISSVARYGGEADLESVAGLLKWYVSKGLRLHAWHLYRFQAMGRGGKANADRFAISDAQWQAVSKSLRTKHKRLPLLLRPDMMHSKNVAFFWGTPSGVWRQGPLGWMGPVDLDSRCATV
jgi:MoaA/NifB/PqqE/SkfB family radical SAM enzyme